jgi:hypothetical protein
VAIIALLKTLSYVRLLIALVCQKRYRIPVVSPKLTLLATSFNSTFKKALLKMFLKIKKIITSYLGTKLDYFFN